jgi:predicted nucleotidyltransferase
MENVMNTQIFENIRTMKRQLLPKDRVILFGSQARGDAHWDSDWDLLVLLNKKKKTSQDEDRYGYPFDEMGWNYGVAINTVLYSTVEWEKKKCTPFYQNVQKDGIEIK